MTRVDGTERIVLAILRAVTSAARRCTLLFACAALGTAAATTAAAAKSPRRTALEQELAAQRPVVSEALRAAGRPEPRTRADAEALSAQLARLGYRDRLLAAGSPVSQAR